MIQKVLVTPIIGLPRTNGWAQVTQSLDGTFIASFSINGSQAGNVGRDLVDLISNSTPDSATSVYALVKKIIRFVEEKDCQIQLAVCYLQNGTTVFATFNGALLLKRGSKLGCVLQSDLEVKLIEGSRTGGDVFILMSQAALTFKEEIFQKLQQGLDADTTVASIVPGVQNLPDSSLVAMAFLTDRPVSDLDERELEVDRPVMEFSAAEEHDGNAVLGSPLIEVLAETNQLPKASSKSVKLRPVVAGLLAFLKKTGLTLFSWLLKIWRRMAGIFSQKVYLDEKARVTNKRLRVAVLVGILVILGLVVLGVVRLTRSSQVKAATVATQESMTAFDQTKLEIETDPIAAREKLAKIISDLEAQEKAFAKQAAGQRYVKAQLDTVRSFYDSVSGKQVFHELPVFYDFQLIQTDFVANQSKFLAGQGYFLDKDNKKLIKLDLTSKKAEVIDLASLKLVNDLAATEQSLYLLGEGIFQRPNAVEGEAQEVIAAGRSNQGAKLMSIFANNLYVFNPEQRNIFKYSPTAEGDKKFADPIRWVRSAKDLDYSLISSLAVDGSIWVSTKDGKIFHFSAGEGSLFEVKGLTEPFTSPLFLVTNENLDNLYLLEPSASRLVVISKQGEFVKEVKSVSLAAGNDLIPLESEQKVLVVSGTLVFEVGL